MLNLLFWWGLYKSVCWLKWDKHKIWILISHWSHAGWSGIAKEPDVSQRLYNAQVCSMVFEVRVAVQLPQTPANLWKSKDTCCFNSPKLSSQSPSLERKRLSSLSPTYPLATAHSPLTHQLSLLSTYWKKQSSYSAPVNSPLTCITCTLLVLLSKDLCKKSYKPLLLSPSIWFITTKWSGQTLDSADPAAMQATLSIQGLLLRVVQQQATHQIKYPA